jgi:hypothetical protein
MFPLLVTLAEKARSAEAHRRHADHLEHSFLRDRTRRLHQKCRQHIGAHEQTAAKTELVDAEKRDLELSKDAIDRELFASLP